MNVLMWFRHDLRVSENAALGVARSAGRLLPVYLIETAEWSRADRSGRQWAFLRECLLDLRQALGGQLVVRMGDPLTNMQSLCRKYRIGRIVVQADSTCEKLALMAAWARSVGIEWQAVAASDEPLAWEGADYVPDLVPGPIPDSAGLGLAHDRCPHRQVGGEVAGLALRDSFLAQRALRYREGAEGALSGERCSSRLSPHLVWGSVSREVCARMVADRQKEQPGRDWGANLRLFQKRLTLAAKPVALPEIPLSEPTFASALGGAWVRGETGLPFVDATMRYFQATGWLSAPMRALLLGFAVQDLGLDPLEAGLQLARFSTDYDRSRHWSQVETVTAAGRVSPLRLAEKLDPGGVFTRRWLPELANVPDAFLQKPWAWEGGQTLLGRRYPRPLIGPSDLLRMAKVNPRPEGKALRPARDSTRNPDSRQLLLALQGGGLGGAKGRAC